MSHLEGMPVPGDIALRARLRYLIDLPAPNFRTAPAAADHRWWIEVIRLETLGDRLLVTNAAEAAAAFEKLAAMELPESPRLVTVHSLIGLGDVARHLEDAEPADRHYLEAIRIAEEDGYRFGVLRALVPLGYQEMFRDSVSEARDIFERAVELAGQLDEQLYLANSLLGRGEACSRLRDPGRAIADTTRALEHFETLKSDVGAGNAAERLASLHLAAGNRDAARGDLRRAAQHQAASGDPVGRANSLDRLAELELAADDAASARRYFEQARSVSTRHGYRRGVVNADLGLAQVDFQEANWESASTGFLRVLDAHESLNDLASQMKCLDGLATCVGHMEGAHAELRVRLLAVQRLELLRAGTEKPQVQQEYRDRFTEIYGAALRNAIEADDARAALFVLECVAGRRLVGLMGSATREGMGADFEFLGQVAAMADQRLTGRWSTPESDSRQDRIRRLLGANAIRGYGAENTRDGLAAAAAAVYLPLDVDAVGPLIEAVPTGAWCVIVAADLAGPGEVVMWCRDPAGEVELARVELGEEVQRWLSDPLEGVGPPPLAASEALLPDGLVQAAVDVEVPALLIVPIGAMWRVPWPGLPLADGRYLGEVARIVVTPSLTMHRSLIQRPVRPSTSRPVRVWRNPTLVHHRLDQTELEPLPSAAVARATLFDAGAGTVALIVHGRDDPDVPYLELAPGEVLPLSSLLNPSEIAPRIAFVACWAAAGQHQDATDPLTFATLALVAGAHEVLATTGESGDSAVASMFVKAVIGSTEPDFARAVNVATRRIMQRDELRCRPIVDWAPLITVGALRD